MSPPNERPKSFQPSKVTVSKLQSVLLDPTYGFTTNEPLVDSPHPGKSSGRASGAQPKNPAASGSSVPPVPDQPPPRPEPSSPGPVELLAVRIYVEDTSVVPIQKTVSVVSLPVLDRTNSGSVRVLSKEVISALQKGNGAIEIPSTGSGVVRISIPDSEDEEFKIPFVRIPHGQNWELAVFDPEALEVAEHGRLKLHVDNASLPSVIKNEAETMNAVAVPGPVSGPSNFEPPAETMEESTDPVVKFLREKLGTRAGYSTFAANRGRTLANPVIVADWQFAVDFTTDYNELKTRVRVTKDSIQKALGIGSTWMSQANTATEIIRKYGEIPEVAEVLGRVEDPPKGSTILYRFLTEWKESHSI
ncbi:hypothetical protein B0H13DRAFT_1917016 [Mycena leptocephala]|nr:hypothetical protein B0H13DRAFT_1917016 [Mycena leptocephala]